ncbi:TIGR03750 family conjugal transfer protein [Alcanivoracaceae bacterium MT1]
MATPTITFVPGRLNQAPVVFRGMTGREVVLVGVAGFILFLPIGLLGGWLTGKPAVIPTAMFAGVALMLWFGGAVLRRLRRGKPETWLYRRLAWRLALRGFNQWDFITRSATYSTRNYQARRRRPPRPSSRTSSL